MPREKISVELMVHLCKLALQRARMRYYSKCFYAMVEMGKDPQMAREECERLASRKTTFHKTDFEVEARIYIAKTKQYYLRISSLLRKLRMLANDPNHPWIRFYKGDYGRQRGIYELKNVEDFE